MKKKLFIIIALTLLSAPYLASACDLPPVWDPGSVKGPLVTCTGNYLTSTKGMSQCQSLADLACTVATDIYVAIAFVIWIILPISLIAGGIMYMLGGANPGMLQHAKKTIWGAIIGAIIVISAYILIATLVHFLNISNIGGFGSPINLSNPVSGSSN